MLRTLLRSTRLGSSSVHRGGRRRPPAAGLLVERLEDRSLFSVTAYFEQAETIFATDGTTTTPVTTGHWPHLSPDERYLVFHKNTNGTTNVYRQDLWVRDLAAGTETRVWA